MLEAIKNYELKHKDLHLVEVTTKNYWELGFLKTKRSQARFVGPNFYGMAYAYATVAEGKFAAVFGIYDGETPVGYAMVGHNSYDYEGCPEVCKHSYDLWRFMIDKHYQKKGYGKDATKLLLDYMLTFPDGEEDMLTTSYEEGNVVAKKLYESFGFVSNGEISHGEVTMVLSLK